MESMIRERQLRDAKLTLEETERLCRANELAQQHAKTFNEASAMAIHDSAKVAVVRNRTMKKNTPQKKDRQCPAYGKRCLNCNGKNPSAKQCLSKDKPKLVRLVKDTDLSETVFVSMVSCVNTRNDIIEESQRHSENEDTWIASLPIDGALVALRIETDALANLISMIEIMAMKEKPKIFKKTVQLKDYNRKDIESKGQCRLKQ